MEANFSRRLLVRDENGDERQRLLMAPTLLSPRPRHGDVSLPLLRPLLRLFQGPPEYKVIGRSIAVHAMEELSRNKKKVKVSRSHTVFSRGFRFQTSTSERKKKKKMEGECFVYETPRLAHSSQSRHSSCRFLFKSKWRQLRVYTAGTPAAGILRVDRRNPDRSQRT